jgi:hypothetical protein
MASLSKKEERKREGKATDRRLEASKFVLVMAIRKEEREGGRRMVKKDSWASANLAPFYAF